MRRWATTLAALLAAGATAVAQTEANDPTSLQQYQSDGTTTIAVGGVATTGTVVLSGYVSGTNATAGYKLRVEVKLTSASFTGTGYVDAATWLSNGSTSTVTVTGLTPGATYHWRARTVMN